MPTVLSQIGVSECDRGSANKQRCRRQTGRAHHPPNSAYGPGRSRPGYSRAGLQCRGPVPLPIPFLYHDDRVGDQRIAAHMVEMEMGVDDEINSRRVVIMASSRALISSPGW